MDLSQVAATSRVLLEKRDMRAAGREHSSKRTLCSAPIVIGAGSPERAAVRHNRDDVAFGVKVVVVLVIGHRARRDSCAWLCVVNVPYQIQPGLCFVILSTVRRESVALPNAVSDDSAA